jgi:hypothetical protein
VAQRTFRCELHSRTGVWTAVLSGRVSTLVWHDRRFSAGIRVPRHLDFPSKRQRSVKRADPIGLELVFDRPSGSAATLCGEGCLFRLPLLYMIRAKKTTTVFSLTLFGADFVLQYQ